ncbi:MAG: copper resistance protein B [Acidobacteria bacterium]|nr:copper resistance protein B [Acidobacteriota bacterium]
MRITTIAVAAVLIGGWPADSRGQTPSKYPADPTVTQQTDDHASHRQGPTKPQGPATSAAPEEHAKHQQPVPPDLPPGILPVTDEDRKAAFPDVRGHAVHDTAVNYFVLFDQLEWQTGGGDAGLNWDNKGWIGRDRDRFWFRSEGESEDGDVAEAEAHLLYGRAIGRWWDFVAGVRQDFRPGPAQTWGAVGIQGLAPYWFELEATAYVGASGRTHVRFEAEYELLLTNRLILQPLVEVQIYGKSDPERGIGAGLGSVDAGLRFRYELRRELAPYVGVTWNRKFFGTADYAEAAGDKTGGAQLALGIRLWL